MRRRTNIHVTAIGFLLLGIGGVTDLGRWLGFDETTGLALAKEEDDQKDEDGDDKEADHLGLAALLIHDKHYDRALDVLSEIDPKDPTLDRVRFYTLRAIAFVQEKSYANARRDFLTAIKSGQKDPNIRLYLAQACFHLKDYACVLGALSKAGKTISEAQPGTLLMRAEAEWESGKKHRAIDTLALGVRKFPKEAEFERIQIFYLIELGLYVEASRISESYLGREQIKEEDYVAVGEALRVARDYRRAQLIMEGARLRFPESDRVLVQLAHAYLDAGKPVASAMLFEEAARLEPKYTLEAAELYKEAGLSFRASWLNARVADQHAKTKQRLSLLVDGQEFEAVTAMLPKLSRLGLLEQDSIRYAVAYSFFKTGRFDQAEVHLKHIRDPALLDSTLQLRKAMETCRKAGWECTL